MILPLLLTLAVALAQNPDPKLQMNADAIFGTPDNPLITVVDNDTVINNIKELFPPPPGETSGATERLKEATTKPTVTSGFNLNPSAGTNSTSCVRSDNNKTGVCVRYYLCDPETKRLITDGETLIDVRVHECPHYLDVCCLIEDVNTTKPVAPTGGLETPSNPHGCGYSNFGDEESYRIINDGTKAEFLEYPWMIALLRSTEAGVAWSQKDYLGGGSLIHPTVVLTAAHKIEGLYADEVKCRAGEWDTQTTAEVYPYQERDVKKIIQHENFYRPSVLNSIALLILSQPYTPSPNIGVACLGRVLPPPGTRCYSMGWGKEDFNAEGKYANILKKVEVPLVSREDCQNDLRRTRLGSYFQLHQSLTCAGGETGIDTCAGDGGSSLVCPVGDLKDLRYAIYGMVAYGIGCADAGVPGVYVNTPSFYGWITEKMKAEHLTTDSFTF